MSVIEIQRGYFLQALDALTQKSKEQSVLMGVLLVDISNLTSINQLNGYGVGDQVLMTAYKRLLSIAKLPNTVFRISGHRFAFILQGLATPAFVTLAVNRVQKLLEEDVLCQNTTIKINTVVGVAVNRDGQLDALGTLRLAESSLHHRRAGGDCVVFEAERVEEEEYTANHSRLLLENHFKENLRNNAFELYYQPKINLRTGKADRVEALLRWPELNGERLKPEMAIDIAESLQEGFSLTKWVVNTALRQLKYWDEQFDLGVAVNIQASLIGHPDLLGLIHDAVSIWGVDESKVTLEITESAIISDKEAGYNTLLKLRDSGLKLSIDDFGTGYSSMSYFKQIPANELKIDKSFVQQMEDDKQNRQLVGIIVDIAHVFGLTVVAEGVETRAALDMLIELGCDYIQGYYFSKALPAEEFEHWLQQWPGLDNWNP